MIQEIINRFYRLPKSKAKEIKRFGGKKAYNEMLLAQQEMMIACHKLKIVDDHQTNDMNIYFLTGKNYLYQTLFCIKSLKTNCEENFNFILIDDGTFDDEYVKLAEKLIPNCKIILNKQLEKNINHYLPIDKYPFLNKKRKVYPHIKKLTDIHTLNHCKGFKLVLDSDMLFYQSPKEIIEWLKNPISPLHMIDCEEAYGYSHQLMEQLCGSAIPELVNVGVIGMDSESINWELLEDWVKQLEEKEGTCYYLEQALSAMLIAGKTATVLTRDTYIVNPSEAEINETTAILHHYVDLSKMGYYTKAWKKFV